MNDDTETLDLKQAAALARIGVEALRELIESGSVPAVSHNKKHMVLVRDQFLAYLRETAIKQAAQRRDKKTQEKRPRVVKPALPVLDNYEITTASQPGLTRAGSRSV